MTPKANCKETVELLLDYVDDKLAPAERAALEAHFAECAACIDFLRSYRAVPRIFRESTEVVMPPDMRARLQRFLAENKRRR